MERTGTGRISLQKRETNETKIRLTLNLDGSGQAHIHTGIGFFDHMLKGFARHGLFDMDLTVEGDLEVKKRLQASPAYYIIKTRRFPA